MKKNYFILLFVFVTTLSSTAVSAQSDPFIGQISIFAGNFAPKNWALCQGQLLPIVENVALFSILGTFYGGDGITTFALPDLRGRVPVQQGTRPGLSSISLGERGGAETVTLNVSNLPSHTHSLHASTAKGTSNVPEGNFLGDTSVFDKEYTTTSNAVMNSGVIGNTGSNLPISIVQPYLGINYIIAVQGIFPPRN